ncbi:MAG: hypothetical protein HYR72_07865 [Deltaproteobacteria bacterium]|nr:hypothetical protein [Deltaproteobacteria bacterium]MBI3387005.1 hypothetical protein [Deltaproteobacteria bacterium]
MSLVETILCRRFARGLIFVALSRCFLATPSHAQVTLERAASMLIFPHVVVSAQQDTIIQLSNTSASTLNAICVYVDGSLTHPTFPQSPANPPTCSPTFFDITLSGNSGQGKQATHWTASLGRRVDALSDNFLCTHSNPPDCDGAGFDPGLVPPAPLGFDGELICFTVDASGVPIANDGLTGDATIKDLTSGDLAQYLAIGLPGTINNNGDGVLCIGSGVSATCPSGAEYLACPDTWILNHVASGTEDPLVGSGSSVSTSLTIVPCGRDFTATSAANVSVQFQVTNEFEATLSATTTVTCFANSRLEDINPSFTRPIIGSDYVQTRIRATGGRGIAVVAQEFRDSGGAQPVTATAGFSAHHEGQAAGQDIIILPPTLTP